MTKTIFVIGCSYSHHDVYVKIEESWPRWLQFDTGYKVINCSFPGSSNFSYYYRLKEMEKQFGFPDKVIVQITGLHRLFLHRKNSIFHKIVKHGYNEYYYDPHESHYTETGAFITPSMVYEQDIINQLKFRYGMPQKFLRLLFRLTTDDNLLWNLKKEMQLIDLYYKNVTFFSWNTEYKSLDVKEYIGSLKFKLLSDKFDEYSIKKDIDDHFNVQGHKAVAKVIKQYV